MKIVLLLLGGGVGAVCRFLLSKVIATCLKERTFFTAILLVNLVGSFGLGLFLGINELAVNSTIPLMVSVGFFGAFTTFSTFSMEAIELIKLKKWKVAFIYITITIFGSIFLCSLGLLLSNNKSFFSV